MDETVVYAMRHAWALDGAGWKNRERPLTAAGWQTARDWVGRLQGLGVERLYSSPYRRAVDTLKPFAATGGFELRLREGLRESAADEVFDAVQGRVVRALERIARAHGGQTVLVCTHGGCLWGMMAHFAEDFSYEDYKKIGTPDLKRFVWRDGTWRWDVGFGPEGQGYGTEVAGVPAFGACLAGAPYRRRPGGYGIVRGQGGTIALVRTPTGYYLPGGGQDAGESLQEALQREGREECGMGLAVGRALGRADEFTYAVEYDEYFRKECSFFVAEPDGRRCEPVEQDHELLWVPIAAAVDLLTQGSQAWAVRKVLASG